MKKYLFVLSTVSVLILTQVLPALALKISGKVTGNNGEPLSFASVYLKGTTKGTTTNIDGDYSMDLAPGKYDLAFKYIGYQLHYESIELADQNLVLNAKLSLENVMLKEVTVSGNGEDPAYAIIRNAIKKRKFYLDEVESFSCDVYIKGLQRIKKYPKKIMGFELNAEKLGIIDTTSGIVYLSESVSKFNYKKPDKIKEEMISSKVSGDNKAFSYNQASDMLFNFYENLITIDDLSDRGFVSPIAASAMIYYNYKLLGTINENGYLINKIQVIPKRKLDPVFKGTIYILENSWRIHSAELMLTKDANIDFVDTLWIQQVMAPVEKEVWLPISNKFDFKFKFLGVSGDGTFLGTNNNYIISPEFPSKFFTNEVLKVKDDANKKDTSYWKTSRSVPLTKEEAKDYKIRDSLQKYHESKQYLDSTDKKNNKFKPINILTGYGYDNSFKKWTLYFPGPIENVQYNTVEGLRFILEPSYYKSYENNKWYNIKTGLRYGVSNKQFNANASYSYFYNPVKFARYTIAAGTDIVQYNGKEPVSELINTFYTLLAKENYLKLYRKAFVSISQSKEIANGVVLRAGAEYADRNSLQNTSNYQPFKKPTREYTSNDPLNPLNEGKAFAQHQALIVSAELRLRYKQKYYTRPNRKVIIGSKYPTLSISYKKGINSLGSDVEYDFVRIGVDDEIKLGLLGTSEYNVGIGKFINSKKMGFMDFQHFSGNQTIIAGFKLDDFKALDYYTYSTNDQYIEGHFQHNFGGFILNKFPLIRRLRLNEIGSIHYLSTNTIKQYMELSVGIQRGIIPFKAEFVTSFAEKKKVFTGFRIGFSF